MPNIVEYVTAETAEGRIAIEEVMRHSYSANIDDFDPKWAIARVVDGVPVSYALITLDSSMDIRGGVIPAGFLEDTATRDDRRREGHFRTMIEECASRLKSVGRSLMLTHGEAHLYRNVGFDVCSTNFGIFMRPELIEMRLGPQSSTEGMRSYIDGNTRQ